LTLRSLSYPSIEGACADEGYRKTFENHAIRMGLTIKISPKTKPERRVIPKRWVTERTFGRLNHSRRLSKDYEIAAYTEKNYIYLSHMTTLIHRLTA
jgi:transposase